MRYAWAPPLSFVCEPEMQPGIPGERRTGALLHQLGEDAAETSLVTPEGLDCHWLADVRAETRTG